MSSARLIFSITILVVLTSSLTMMGQEQGTEPKWKMLSKLYRRWTTLASRCQQGGGILVADKSRKEEAVAETLIRQRIEDYAKAISAKDIDRVMSLYSSNIVSFDLNPPLRYAGTDNKRRAWQEFFATYTGPVAYEVRDLNVTTEGDLAFVYSLNHVKGALGNGHVTDLWVRWTACLRRIDGVWLVVHDHVSDPADLEHGKAVLNLTP